MSGGLKQEIRYQAGRQDCRAQCTPGYKDLLAPLPLNVSFVKRVTEQGDVVHLFIDTRAALAAQLARNLPRIRPDAAIWVSWPKKSSGVVTDVTEDVIRAVALPMGLVDVKVCAVDDTWSGLKLVIRKENRRKD
jgi:hypothetical protein